MQKNRQNAKKSIASIEAVAEEFFRNNKAKGLAAATCETYEVYVKQFSGWFGGYRNIGDVQPVDLDSYVIWLKGRGMKDISAATAMKHLRRLFKFAVERGYAAPIEIPIPRYEKTLKEPYTEAEMAKLLERPKTASWTVWRNWAMVNYFFSTGQRLSTVLNIKVQDVDIESQTVRLIWNKDKRQKIMPLSSALTAVLKEYIEMSDFDDDEYLFPHPKGGKMAASSAQSAVKTYNHSRGVERSSIHLFRHTFAKNYIIAGGNPMKLQKLLNHKSMEMTRRYVSLYSNDIALDLDLYDPLARYKNKPKVLL